MSRNKVTGAAMVALTVLLSSCETGDRLAPLVPKSDRQLVGSAAPELVEPASHGDPHTFRPGDPMVLFVIKGGVLKDGEQVDVTIHDQNEDPDFYGGDRWGGVASLRLGDSEPNHRGGVGRAPVDGDPPVDAHREFRFGLAEYNPGGGGEVDGDALVVRSHRGKIEVYAPAGLVERQFRQGRVELAIMRGEFPEVVRRVEFTYDQPPARVPLPIVNCIRVEADTVKVCAP